MVRPIFWALQMFHILMPDPDLGFLMSADPDHAPDPHKKCLRMKKFWQKYNLKRKFISEILFFLQKCGLF